VVVVLLPAANGLVVIRRNTEPQKEPSPSQGGDLDVGESWQERGKRELLEETGIDISGSELAPYGVMNGLDGTLIAFGLAARHPSSSLRPFASEETEEVALIDRPIELGFSMHTRLVARYFAGQGGQRPLQRR
jgi:ADP-ribose pyrophosphatase YjhB (NUDIX family)